METRKKYVRAFGLLLILLALGSFIGTKESKAALPAEPENTLTIMAELSWPEGSPLRSDMVQLSFGDIGSNYQLGAAEVFQISVGAGPAETAPGDNDAFPVGRRGHRRCDGRGWDWPHHAAERY